MQHATASLLTYLAATFLLILPVVVIHFLIWSTWPPGRFKLFIN